MSARFVSGEHVTLYFPEGGQKTAYFVRFDEGDVVVTHLDDSEPADSEVYFPRAYLDPLNDPYNRGEKTIGS